jgi:flagellar FliJ protein
MAFKFRLQPVLTFRSSIEEKAQLALAREQRLLEEHRRRLDLLQAERRAMMVEFEQRKKEAMTANLYSMYVDGLQAMEREIHLQAGTLASQRKIVESRRQELARCMQDRKVMERLKEKDHQAYIAETLRQEQKISDDQAVLRHGKRWL